MPVMHMLCSTCVGEFDRRCGGFESEYSRRQVGPLHSPPPQLEQKVYCCKCGQAGFADAVFFTEEKSVVCDGEHEVVTDSQEGTD